MSLPAAGEKGLADASSAVFRNAWLSCPFRRVLSPAARDSQWPAASGHCTNTLPARTSQHHQVCGVLANHFLAGLVRATRNADKGDVRIVALGHGVSAGLDEGRVSLKGDAPAGGAGGASLQAGREVGRRRQRRVRGCAAGPVCVPSLAADACASKQAEGRQAGTDGHSRGWGWGLG